jgi:hypothetical protein
MSEKLWVEYKTEQKAYKHEISFERYEFVGDLIEKIRSESRFSPVKDTEITLYESSGAAISIGDLISSHVPGNSFTNPLRIRFSALPPVRVKSSSDASLTSFWSSLVGLTKKDGFLHFPVRPRFFPEKLNSLYIREAYEDLFQIICNNLNSENEAEGRFHHMAITGTLGTGKSVFLFYILWRLANMETTKTVILRRQKDEKAIHVFQNDGCWKTRNIDQIDEFLEDPTTWYLTDALQPPPGVVKAITILVSSPAKKYYSEFLKDSCAPPLHYLPIWSLEELKLLANSYSKSLEEVEDRFNLIGGIPRYVLENNVDLKELIEEAIDKMNLHRLVLIGIGEEAPDDRTSHRIVHFDVESPCYTRRSMIIASEYVRNKILEKYIGSREEELKDFLATCKIMTSMASVCGNLLEAYANEKLSAGGGFLM